MVPAYKTGSAHGIGDTLAVLFLLVHPCVAVACAWHYVYKQEDTLYYAVEAGRVVTLKQVSIRETSSPFIPWNTVLVQPCPANEKVAPTDTSGNVPCWPEQPSNRTQQLLASLRSGMPDYRDTWSLLQAARYLNREIGAFHPAWVVGTSPVVVAFRQGTADPAPYADFAERGATTRPTTIPGVIEIVSRSGEATTFDRRARKAQLVTEADLKAVADVILVFPQEMQLPWGQLPADKAGQKLKVYYLDQSKPLGWLMDALRQGTLDREAKNVVERPVTER